MEESDFESTLRRDGSTRFGSLNDPSLLRLPDITPDTRIEFSGTTSHASFENDFIGEVAVDPFDPCWPR
jgi:hypothetical protein